jgi:glycosyltransferase involved in cell wall biosynthesis
LHYFFGYSYSFTGHANDLFCEKDHPVKLKTLVEDSALVISVSDYALNYLRTRFPNAESKIKRVYNGLDLTPFEAAASARDAGAVWTGTRLVLSVGRLVEKKGFDDLVEACSVLSARAVENVRCVVVGDGPMRQALLQKVADLKVRNVEFVGARSQAQIIDLMGRATFFVLPCVTEADGGRDNLPTVIMEAMAARLACLSTKVAGVPEMIVDGLTGRLVPERRPDLLADAMMWLLANASPTEAMGSEALARAQMLFAKEATVGDLHMLFAERGLLAQPASPTPGRGSRALCAVTAQAGRLKRYLQPKNWRNPRRRS